jgi:hypothetical protein
MPEFMEGANLKMDHRIVGLLYKAVEMALKSGIKKPDLLSLVEEIYDYKREE